MKNASNDFISLKLQNVGNNYWKNERNWSKVIKLILNEEDGVSSWIISCFFNSFHGGLIIWQGAANHRWSERIKRKWTVRRNWVTKRMRRDGGEWPRRKGSRSQPSQDASAQSRNGLRSGWLDAQTYVKPHQGVVHWDPRHMVSRASVGWQSTL